MTGGQNPPGTRNEEVHVPETPTGGRWSLRQGAKVLLMDGTAVKSAFALLLARVTEPDVPGVNFFFAVSGIRQGGEKAY